MDLNLSPTCSLIVENLLPVQDENTNADTGDALFSHRPLIVDDLVMVTSAVPLQENIFLELPAAMIPNNPFPELMILENQAGTARRGEEIQSHPLDPRLFQCSFCGYTSDRRHNVQVHEQQHDPNREREFHCSECPEQFFRPYDRNRHIRSVHKNERYVCHFPHCTKYYSRKGNLMKHIDCNHYRM